MAAQGESPWRFAGVKVSTSDVGVQVRAAVGSRQNPHAAVLRLGGVSVSEQTAWSAAAQAQGTTLSERILAKLARKAFLSLWS
jgi:hypothetical protein